MKKYVLLLVTNLLIITAFGQEKGKEYGEKGKQKVENRVDNKVDQAMDKALNKIEGLFSKKPKKKSKDAEAESSGEAAETAGNMGGEEGQSRDYEEEGEEEMEEEEKDEEYDEDAAAREMMSRMFGKQETPEDYVPQTNEFIGSFTMTFISYKNGKETKDSPTSIHFHYAPTKTGLVMEPNNDKKARVVMNLTDNSMTLVGLDNGKNQAIRMQRPQPGEVVNTVLEDMKITPTGEFRTIENYRCEKVLSEDLKSGDKTTSWVARNFPVDYKKVYESMTMGRVQASSPNYHHLQGFMLESKTVSKDGKEVVTTKTSNIKIGSYDKSVFDLTGVDIINMPGLYGQ